MTKGHIRTVRGPIRPQDLGWTITHEHLLVDEVAQPLSPAASAADGQAWEQELTLANHYEARRECMLYRDNMSLLSIDEAADECLRFREFGGSCVVDQTPWGLGRDPVALRQISIRTGVHVVMGTGYYVRAYHPPELARWDLGYIRDAILRDVEVGTEKANVDPETYARFSGASAGGDRTTQEARQGTAREHRIKPGIIGEVGLSWPVHPDERKVLQASAEASTRTGLPLSIHIGRNPGAGMDAVRMVEQFGGDPTRTVICHVDLRIGEVNTMLELARTGATLELDAFGWEEAYYPFSTHTLPNDAQRVRFLQALMSAGFGDQLLISHDIDVKARTDRYGGEGRQHIVKRVVPLMRQMGMSWEEIDHILIDNPARILTIV